MYRYIFLVLGLLSNYPVWAADSWTILVYGHADHNLSYALMQDMLEMEQVGSSKDFNIVVQADYDASTSAQYKGTFRYLVEQTQAKQAEISGNLSAVPGSTPLSITEELDFDKPEVLKAFLQWGMKNYPAQHYGVIFWNHGGQWDGGFGGDSQDGTNPQSTGLKISQINQVLTEVRSEFNVNKFDFISFDTCLLNGAELLPDIVPHTNTYIANAELDFGAGWDYAGTLNWLKANPSATMVEFAKNEVKYYALHHSIDEGDKALKAHAALDLTKYPDYKKAAYAFFNALSKLSLEQLNTVQQIRAKTTQYSLGGINEIKNSTNYIDLGEFATHLSTAELTTEVKSTAQTLATAIDAMFIDRDLGSLRKAAGAKGLSIYYPQAGLANTNYGSLSFISEVVDFIKNKWLDVLQNVAILASSNTAPEIEAPATIDTLPSDNPLVADFSVTIKDQNLFAVRTSIVSKNFAKDKQAYFADNAVILPIIEAYNYADGYLGYYKGILTLNAQGQFDFVLNELDPNDVISGLIIPAYYNYHNTTKATLTIPFVNAYDVNYQVTLEYDTQTGGFALISAEVAELVTYLGEVSYSSVDDRGTYPIKWDGSMVMLNGEQGQQFPVSGFRTDPNNDFLYCFALYTPALTSGEVKTVMLQINTADNTVIAAFDAETNEDIAPRGLELESNGLLLPLYYTEVRTAQTPEKWYAFNLVGEVSPMTIPSNGIAGLSITKEKQLGTYLLEISSEDDFGSTSQPSTFEVTVQ